MVGELGDVNRALGKPGLCESPGPGRGLFLLCCPPTGDYRCCLRTAQIEALRPGCRGPPHPQGCLSVLVSGDTEVMRRASAGTLQAFGTPCLPPSHFPLAVKPPKILTPTFPQTNLQAGPFKIF